MVVALLVAAVRVLRVKETMAGLAETITSLKAMLFLPVAVVVRVLWVVTVLAPQLIGLVMVAQVAQI
jgi:hypothetical protein